MVQCVILLIELIVLCLLRCIYIDLRMCGMPMQMQLWRGRCMIMIHVNVSVIAPPLLCALRVLAGDIAPLWAAKVHEPRLESLARGCWFLDRCSSDEVESCNAY